MPLLAEPCPWSSFIHLSTFVLRVGCVMCICAHMVRPVVNLGSFSSFVFATRSVTKPEFTNSARLGWSGIPLSQRPDQHWAYMCTTPYLLVDRFLMGSGWSAWARSTLLTEHLQSLGAPIKWGAYTPEPSSYRLCLHRCSLCF